MSDRGELESALVDARQRTLALVADLGDEQLRGPRLATVNPLLWEIGHVAWFQELWVLRHALGEAPIRADGDALWDSGAIAHDTRWDLPLPSRPQTLGYRAPALSGPPGTGGAAQAGAWRGDAHVPGGPFVLGAREEEPFVFDNEKWAHPVVLAPFAIARAPVSQSEFAEFVEDRGYGRKELWS